MIATTNKPVTLKPRQRKALNEGLHEFCSRLYDGIPLEEIFAVVEACDLRVVDEDGEPWQGMLCGQSGRANFDLATDDGTPVKNAALALFWYRFETGRFEITAYVS